MIVGQAQQVGVVARRLQRGREQGAGVCRSEARLQKGCGHHVADADHGIAGLGGVTVGGLGDVHHRMRIQQVGHALQVQGVEVERLQRAIGLGGVVGEMLGERGGALLQRGQQLVGEDFEHRVRGRVRLVQRHPGAAHLVQRLLHRRMVRSGGAAAGLGQGGGVQLGGEHLAAALHQVVGLVHQQRRAPLVGLGQAVQQPAQVKVVVVVAHHHIGPAGQLLAQVVGTNIVLQCDLTHAGLDQGRGWVTCAGVGHRSGAGGWQPVVKAPGQRARFAMAGLVGVLAGLVARHQLQHAQGQRWCVVG